MRAQLAERRRRLRSGERPLGWKVGFGSPDAIKRLRTDAPLIGFLTDASVVDSGASVSLRGWAAPVVEPEIAAHMAAELPPQADRASARRAIAALGPAFELADVDPPPAEVEAILAGNIFQRRVVLGPARAGSSASELRAHLTFPDGTGQAIEDPQAPTGEILDIVGHVADLLGELGETLGAGEVVICGSIVPPIAVRPKDSFSYALDPAGTVSIRFVA
jgi:2-keto-4-pentenoate hydratase